MMFHVWISDDLTDIKPHNSKCFGCRRYMLPNVIDHLHLKHEIVMWCLSNLQKPRAMRIRRHTREKTTDGRYWYKTHFGRVRVSFKTERDAVLFKTFWG
jgi:hypothetical protein